MVALRWRAAGAGYAPLWLGAFAIALLPRSVGYQDFAAHFAHKPAQTENLGGRWGDHLLASPFGTIERATFSYARPIGTAIPRPPGYIDVNYDPDAPDAKAWQIDRPLGAPRRLDYPTVDRTHKGDRLPAATAAPAPAQSLPQLQPFEAAPPPSAPSAQPM